MADYYWANARKVDYSSGSAVVSSDPVSLHDPSHSEESRVVNGSLKLSAEEIDSFTFDLMRDHAMFGSIAPYVWLVKVCQHHDATSSKSAYDETLFTGRVIGVETGMDEDGVIYKTVTCESAKGFMQDTYVFIDKDSVESAHDGAGNAMLCPTTTSNINGSKIEHSYYNDGTFKVPAGVLMQHAINRHNAQCESSLSGFSEGYKKLSLSMEGSWQTTACYVEAEYDTCVWDYVSDLAEEVGAELVMDYNGSFGACALTVRNSGSYSGTAGTIAIGDNMCSCSSDLAPDELVTALHVWGDQVDVDAKAGGIEYETQDRLSLSLICADTDRDELVTDTAAEYGFDHASGSIIIYSKAALKKYGAIHAAYAIDGIFDTDKLAKKPYKGDMSEWAKALKKVNVEKLVRRACRYLKRHCSVKPSVTVSALDLSLIGTDHSAFRLLNRWAVSVTVGNGSGQSKQSIIDDKLLVSEITISLDDPGASTVTLGRKRRRAMNTAVHSKVRAEKKKSGKRSEKSSQSSKSSKYSSSGDSTAKGSSGYTHKVVEEKPSDPASKTIYFVTGE